jgi:hypothetical protein
MNFQIFWGVTPFEAVHKNTAHNLLNLEDEKLKVKIKSTLVQVLRLCTGLMAHRKSRGINNI